MWCNFEKCPLRLFYKLWFPKDSRRTSIGHLSQLQWTRTPYPQRCSDYSESDFVSPCSREIFDLCFFYWFIYFLKALFVWLQQTDREQWVTNSAGSSCGWEELQTAWLIFSLGLPPPFWRILSSVPPCNIDHISSNLMMDPLSNAVPLRSLEQGKACWMSLLFNRNAKSFFLRSKGDFWSVWPCSVKRTQRNCSTTKQTPSNREGTLLRTCRGMTENFEELNHQGPLWPWWQSAASLRAAH